MTRFLILLIVFISCQNSETAQKQASLHDNLIGCWQVDKVFEVCFTGDKIKQLSGYPIATANGDIDYKVVNNTLKCEYTTILGKKDSFKLDIQSVDLRNSKLLKVTPIWTQTIILTR